MIYGIDVNCLTRENYTGTERYVFSLLKQMMALPLKDGEEVVLYAAAKVKRLGELPKGWRWSILNWPLAKGWTHGRLSWELVRRTPNVFFSPAHEIPRFYGRTKIVNTIHDIAFVYFPKAYSWHHRRRHAWSVKRTLRKASAILTVSEATKQDLIKEYKANPQNITPTPLAVDTELFQASEEEQERVLQHYRLFEDRYFFFVGRLEEKKNVVTLIRAFEEYKKRRGAGDPMQLVLAGTFGYEKEQIQAKIEDSSVKNDIRPLGFVPDQDLPGLFAGSLAFTFPSLYEGFGMPILEAMLVGTPVLASDIPTSREVADDAALYAPTQSVAMWAEQMDRLVRDSALRNRLVEKGNQCATQFSWAKTAETTWSVLRSV